MRDPSKNETRATKTRVGKENVGGRALKVRKGVGSRALPVVVAVVRVVGSFVPRGEGRGRVVSVVGEEAAEAFGVGGVEGFRVREKKERRGDVGLEYFRGARVGGDCKKGKAKEDQHGGRGGKRDASLKLTFTSSSGLFTTSTVSTVASPSVGGGVGGTSLMVGGEGGAGS